jgi:hypothetical protein
MLAKEKLVTMRIALSASMSSRKAWKMFDV